MLQAEAFEAAEKFGQAVSVYQRTLEEASPRDRYPEQWAELKLLIGNAGQRWANRSISFARRLPFGFLWRRN